jgi:HEPN domain-containing protein
MKTVELTQELIRVWMSFGTENNRVARAIVDEDFKPYNSVCFHTVSAAGKFFKVYLFTKNLHIGKTHDLVHLLKKCYNFDKSFQELYPQARILNSFTIAGLHPEDLGVEQVSREDALEAIDAAETIEKFIRDKLGVYE